MILTCVAVSEVPTPLCAITDIQESLTSNICTSTKKKHSKNGTNGLDIFVNVTEYRVDICLKLFCGLFFRTADRHFQLLRIFTNVP